MNVYSKSKRPRGSRSAGHSPAVAEASRPRTRNPNQPAILSKKNQPFRMFLIPCSCGTTFSVAENYDRQGTAWSRYLICPGCSKRHDPKNRLLQMGFQSEGYWKVDEC